MKTEKRLSKWEGFKICLANFFKNQNICPKCGQKRTYWRSGEPTCWKCDLVPPTTREEYFRIKDNRVEKEQITTNPGDYIIVQIVGTIGTYIAEVVKSEPLVLKVEEDGPFAHLKDGDIIINVRGTLKVQSDQKSNTNLFLEERQKQGQKTVSGLKSLGVTDGKLHEILPG